VSNDRGRSSATRARWILPDGRTAARALLRVALAAACFWAKTLEGVPDVLAIAGALTAIALAIKVVIDWARTADWEHDARLTREGNARAHLRRAEAREIGQAIREQRRLAKQRRQRSGQSS
jgi:hypothetical protein